MPTLYDLLGPLVPEREVTPFFIKVVTDAMKYRKERNVFRPDFIDTLMKLRDDPESLSDIGNNFGREELKILSSSIIYSTDIKVRYELNYEFS